jgi:hypothetical protein
MMFEADRKQPREAERIVAVGLLTQTDLDMLGSTTTPVSTTCSPRSMPPRSGGRAAGTNQIGTNYLTS